MFKTLNNILKTMSKEQRFAYGLLLSAMIVGSGWLGLMLVVFSWQMWLILDNADRIARIETTRFTASDGRRMVDELRPEIERLGAEQRTIKELILKLD